MLKKILLALALSVAFCGFASAENTTFEPIMDPGTLAVNGGLSFGWGIGAGGGAEFVFARIDIAEVFPITFGAAGRGYFSTAWGYSFLDLAAMGTAHFGFRGLDVPENVKRWIDPFDYYIGVGIGVSLLDGGYDWGLTRSPVNIASMSGVNYFLNDNLAINFEGGYMGYWGYGLIGVLFKF